MNLDLFICVNFCSSLSIFIDNRMFLLNIGMMCFLFFLIWGVVVFWCLWVLVWIFVWGVGVDILWSVFERLFWGLIFWVLLVLCMLIFFGFSDLWIIGNLVVVFLVGFISILGLVFCLFCFIWFICLGFWFLLSLILDLEEGEVDLIEFFERNFVVGFCIWVLNVG